MVDVSNESIMESVNVRENEVRNLSTKKYELEL